MAKTPPSPDPPDPPNISDFPPLLSNPSLLSHPPTPDLTPTPWKELFKLPPSASRFPPPSYLDDGTPVVLAPPSLLLKSSGLWKDWIVADFFGTPPPTKKISSDLNPIWGTRSPITVRRYSDTSCLILIPHLPTRKWALDMGFWSTGTVSFFATPWSPSPTFHNSVLTSAPLWLTIRNLPPLLWTQEGVDLVISGFGESLPPAKQLRFSASGDTRVRALVSLEKPPPRAVVVQDSAGTTITVDIVFDRLPALCSHCHRYGHMVHRCPKQPPSTSHTIKAQSVNESQVQASTTVYAPPLIKFGTYTPPAISTPASSSMIPNPSQSSQITVSPPSYPLPLQNPSGNVSVPDPTAKPPLLTESDHDIDMVTLPLNATDAKGESSRSEPHQSHDILSTLSTQDDPPMSLEIQSLDMPIAFANAPPKVTPSIIQTPQTDFSMDLDLNPHHSFEQATWIIALRVTKSWCRRPPIVSNLDLPLSTIRYPLSSQRFKPRAKSEKRKAKSHMSMAPAIDDIIVSEKLFKPGLRTRIPLAISRTIQTPHTIEEVGHSARFCSHQRFTFGGDLGNDGST